MGINFDYDKAIKQAKKIDAIASDMLDVISKKIQAAVDVIGACWQGDASRQFLRYCITAQDDVKTQARNLRDVAERIREVARIIKEAEERAKEQQKRAAAKSGGFSFIAPLPSSSSKTS